MAPPEGELAKAEGEAWRRTKLAGLGASPSVAARQLPLGGSSWIGLLARCVRRFSWIGLLARRGGSCHGVAEGGSPAPKLGGPPSAFGIAPRKAGGEGILACSEDS